MPFSPFRTDSFGKRSLVVLGKRRSIFLSALCSLLSVVLLLLCCADLSAQEVPAQYRKYLLENRDTRSLPEKILNKVGLTRADVGRSFALLCGISTYPNIQGKHGNLKPAAEDIQKLQAYLKQHEFFDEVVVLRNKQVTLANLEYFLQTYFPARLKQFPKSRFLFAYSGHGMTENNKGYLLKSTARSLDDKEHAIPVKVLKVYIDEVVAAAHQVLVLLNSCHSGVFLKRPYGKLLLLPKYPGAHAITASGPSELAWHIKEVGSGSIFYEKLLAGISGIADAEKDGIVTSHELYSYLRREIQLVSNQDQTPQMGDISEHGSRGEFFFLKRETPLVQQEGVKVSGGTAMGEGGSQQDRRIGQYIDHGNGTITDTKTGLMWKRCAEGLSGINCEKGKVKRYAWDEVVKRFKNVFYAGYSDWRLPSIDELKTLVYCSKGLDKEDNWCKNGSEKPAINQQAFPNTETIQFWSRSPLAVYSNDKWYINFFDGGTFASYRGGNYAVRLVRGGTSRSGIVGATADTFLGQAVGGMTEREPHQNAASLGEKKIGQYIDHGNGTITDTKTGLMWKRCSEGLSGVNCEKGKAEEYEFNDAVKRFKNIEYAGYADWRLSTIDELETLVYCSNGWYKKLFCKDGSKEPTINQQAFPNTTLSYWHKTPLSYDPDSGEGSSLPFGFGASDFGGFGFLGTRGDSLSAVRLVRSGVRLENKTENVYQFE
ncbi:MAG: DUF1566 domain-containing protein [Candidatus Electrothrix sp. LOE1_4_5]|nr:DUF1566 domain-containing protein [Candidatus Electrothrix gigas]